MAAFFGYIGKYESYTAICITNPARAALLLLDLYLDLNRVLARRGLGGT